MLPAVKHWSGNASGLLTCPFLPIAEAAAPPPRLNPGAAPQLAEGSDGGALAVCLHVVGVGVVQQLLRLLQQPQALLPFDSTFRGKAAGRLGECGVASGLTTRDSGYSGSRLACCCERRCDARVRLQQRGCSGLSNHLRKAQRSLSILQQRGGARGRQALPLSRLCALLTSVL